MPASLLPRGAALLRAAGLFICLAAMGRPIGLLLHTLETRSSRLHAMISSLQSGTLSPTPLILMELTGLLILLPASITMIGTERRASAIGPSFPTRILRRLNIPGQPDRLRHLGTGLALGLLAMLALFAIQYTLGGFTLTRTPGPLPTRLASLALYLLGFFLVGLREELSDRGYLQSTLTDAFGFTGATLVTSLWFGYGHYTSHDPLPGVIETVEFALFACGTLRLTGSLWFIIGFHTTWDWAQTALLGTSDSGHPALGSLLHSTPRGPVWISGGSVGPEGSLPSLVLWAILAITPFWLAHRRRSPHANVE